MRCRAAAMGINVKAIKPPPKEASVERFLDAAPVVEVRPPKAGKKKDKGAAPNTALRGQMVQTTITMTPADLAEINAAAKAEKLTRAGFIRMAVFQYINKRSKR